MMLKIISFLAVLMVLPALAENGRDLREMPGKRAAFIPLKSEASDGNGAHGDFTNHQNLASGKVCHLAKKNLQVSYANFQEELRLNSPEDRDKLEQQVWLDLQTCNSACALLESNLHACDAILLNQ